MGLSLRSVGPQNSLRQLQVTPVLNTLGFLSKLRPCSLILMGRHSLQRCNGMLSGSGSLG